MSAPISASTWTRVDQEPVRVLIVDDSVVVRSVLDRIISAHAEFVVARKTSTAEQALAFLQTEQVDIILLDVEMPGQSGLAALPAILKTGAGAKVVILSGNCDEGSAAAVEALAIGASDILAKPGSGSFGDQFGRSLLARIARLAGRGRSIDDAEVHMPLRSAPLGRTLGCLGVGASTGGIHALMRLFAGIEAPLGVPILVTQHLPPSFIPYFAAQMGRATELPVTVAQAGEVLKPDHIYIAPGEANLECRRAGSIVTVHLTSERAPSGSLPAVDPMFAAMAHAYGAGSAGIVLTGMGRDGTAGGREIVDRGGWIVAQDEASSVVWGMPGSVARSGLACAVLPPEDMMTFVTKRAMVKA
jgi:two-component system chemotaxis response regulator CheB